VKVTEAEGAHRRRSLFASQNITAARITLVFCRLYRYAVGNRNIDPYCYSRNYTNKKTGVQPNKPGQLLPGGVVELSPLGAAGVGRWEVYRG